MTCPRCMDTGVAYDLVVCKHFGNYVAAVPCPLCEKERTMLREDRECEDVREFHERFGLTCPDAPNLPPQDVIDYRVGFMLEEVGEFAQAARLGDAELMLDALEDLVYVAKGTALMCGFRRAWGAAWDEVHAKNMLKERGPTRTRGHRLDVKKPPGWTPPDHGPALRAAGYNPEGWRAPSLLSAEPDTSDIPEATAEDFTRARLREPPAEPERILVPRAVRE
jgi:predicted HAD superfamily Cof-like phosphohydrolase